MQHLDPGADLTIPFQNTVFDVTIVLPFLANEVGFFLAHRFKSAQVQYFTGQVSASTMDFSMGQPHNPAYLPFLMFQYTHPMTFPKRILNTVATWLLHYGARWVDITLKCI